jgi:hypothetical protein
VNYKYNVRTKYFVTAISIPNASGVTWYQYERGFVRTDGPPTFLPSPEEANYGAKIRRQDF